MKGNRMVKSLLIAASLVASASVQATGLATWWGTFYEQTFPCYQFAQWYDVNNPNAVPSNLLYMDQFGCEGNAIWRDIFDGPVGYINEGSGGTIPTWECYAIMEVNKTIFSKNTEQTYRFTSTSGNWKIIAKAKVNGTGSHVQLLTVSVSPSAPVTKRFPGDLSQTIRNAVAAGTYYTDLIFEVVAD